MTDQQLREFFQQVSRTLGMWTSHATFAEACAFVNGFDAARQGALLDGFQPWLVERTGSHRPELAWSTLVHQHAFPTVRPSQATMSPDEDKTARTVLFALLDEYLASVATQGNSGSP